MKRNLEAYDNAETYSFEKKNEEIYITNFNDYKEKQEWKKSVAYIDFTNAFVK